MYTICCMCRYLSVIMHRWLVYLLERIASCNLGLDLCWLRHWHGVNRREKRAVCHGHGERMTDYANALCVLSQASGRWLPSTTCMASSRHPSPKGRNRVAASWPASTDWSTSSAGLVLQAHTSPWVQLHQHAPAHTCLCMPHQSPPCQSCFVAPRKALNWKCQLDFRIHSLFMG